MEVHCAVGGGVGYAQATAGTGNFSWGGLALSGAAARFGTTEEPTTTAKPVVTEDPTVTVKPTPVEEPTGPSACSFTGDTPVLLGDGSTVSISTIGAGQSVTATDPGTGTSSVESVTSVWPHVDRIWDVGLSDGTVIESTANHPWWVASERGFIRTDHVPIGGTVLAASGTTVTIVTVVDTGRTQATYNLTVTGPHTYHIGDDSILVHNCGNGATPVDLDSISASGARQIRPNGLTKAGQELTKHGGEGEFPKPKGSPTQISETAQYQLDDILTNPGTIVRPITAGQFMGGQYLISPNGRGVAIDANGVFQYFGTFKL